jgi:hypothetical protein
VLSPMPVRYGDKVVMILKELKSHR